LGLQTFLGSPDSHSQSVSWSVGITSSCSLQVFPLSVSLTSASVSWYLDLVTVLAYSSVIATLELKAAIKWRKVRSHGSMYIA